MKKALFLVLSFLLIIGFTFTGCAGNDKQSSLKFIRLSTETSPEDYKYSTEVVSKGNITKSVRFTTSFSFTGVDQDEPILVKTYLKTDKGYNLFKKGEAGLIRFNIKNFLMGGVDNNNTIKTFELKAIVSDVVNVNENVQKVIVKIDDEYIRSNIKKNTRAIFQVATETKENKLRVPLTALKFYGGTAVASVYKDEVKSDRVIKTGFIGDEYAEVISGVAAGETVVTGAYTNN
ncbi:MAG: hypothetical protein ACYCYI_01770 [Saccharofermentanales bacterium]